MANEIQHAIKLSICKQCVTTKGPITVDQLHIFADASTKAYDAIAYLRSGNHTASIMAKTTVAPLKEFLPRLELMATVVATRVSVFVIDSLSLQGIPLFLWSDSQIALFWTKQKKTLTSFVSNHVTSLHQQPLGAIALQIKIQQTC